MSYFNPSEINLSAIGEEEYMEELDEETAEEDTSYSRQSSTSSETPASGRKRKEREMVPEATPQGPKRKNRKLKEEDREVSIPYQVLAALFFLNAEGYQTMQPMYTFVRVFFTKCLPQGTITYEGSLRAYVTTGEWYTGRKCSPAEETGEGEKKGKQRELKEWAFKDECKQAFENYLTRWMRDNGRVEGFKRGMTYPENFDLIVSGNYRQPTQDEIDAWGMENTRLGRKSPEEIRKAHLQLQERERNRAILSIAPFPYQGDYNAPALIPASPQGIAYRVVQNAPGSSRQSQGSYHQVQRPQQPYLHHRQQPIMRMPNPHLNRPAPQQYQQEAFHQQMPVQDNRVVFQQRQAEEIVQMDNRPQERAFQNQPLRQPQQPAPTPPHRILFMSKVTPSAPILPLATPTRYTPENVLAARSEDKLSETLRATRNVLDHAMDNARKQDYKMIIRRKQKSSVPDKEIGHENAAENANEAVTPGEEEAGAAEMGNSSNKVTHNQQGLPDDFLDGK